MFCRNCGHELKEGATVCMTCGLPAGKGNAFCPACGSETHPEAVICVHCGVSLTQKRTVDSEAKSKLAAGLFGIFLGSFGVHNFYLGYNQKAIAQLLMTVLSCFALSFVTGVWGLIEGVMILAGNIDTDADGKKLGD